MAAPYANVTVANVIAGAASSFKVDGTETGGTNGGVDVERQMKFTGLQVDQVPGDVADIITGDDITVKTVLAEATLANLKLAWNASGTVTTQPGPPATQTLPIGVESGLAKEHALVFVGPCPAGTYTTRTYTLHKAISYATGQAFKLEKNGPTLFPVTFKIHPDLTQAQGSEYGTIVDQ